MKIKRFKFISHPGDLFRNDSVQILPDFYKNKKIFGYGFIRIIREVKL